MSDFLGSTFSLVMANTLAAGEKALLTLDKKEPLESKLLRASSEKIPASFDLYVYNLCQ